MSESRADLSFRIDELESSLPYLKMKHPSASRLRSAVGSWADSLLGKADFNDQVWAFLKVNAMLERHAMAPLDYAD